MVQVNIDQICRYVYCYVHLVLVHFVYVCMRNCDSL